MPRSNKAFGSYQSGSGCSIEPAIPARWDVFLKELNVTEMEALTILRSRSELTPRIRSWVMTNHRSAFVPEDFLMTLGIQMELYEN
jgi:hypothetical protein